MHGGAYEWNTLYTFKSSDGAYKVCASLASSRAPPELLLHLPAPPRSLLL